MASRRIALIAHESITQFELVDRLEFAGFAIVFVDRAPLSIQRLTEADVLCVIADPKFTPIVNRTVEGTPFPPVLTYSSDADIDKILATVNAIADVV